MPSNSGFSLDYDSVVRIARAVWEVERSLGIPGESEGDKDSGVRNTRLLEVNGALSGGLYPAICKDHDGTKWVYSESCFAVDSNGGTLTVGNTYIGRRTRSVSDGGVAKSVFAVQASGGGGGGSDVKIFLCGNQDTTNFPAASRVYTASFECSWNVANNNFECAGLSQLIRLADVNRVDLVAGKRYIGNYVASKTVAAGTLKIYAVRSPVDVVSDITCLDGVMTVTKIRSN